MYDILDAALYMAWVFCTFQICGNDRGIPTQTLTDDRDEQNDAVYGQIHTLRVQLLLLDDHCRQHRRWYSHYIICTSPPFYSANSRSCKK